MALQKTHKDCILYLLKHFSVFFLFSFKGYSQISKASFQRDSIKTYLNTDSVFNHKLIPCQYSFPIKIALNYFPELRYVKIDFKVKHQISPLSARPSILSVFKRPSKRNYLITISDKTSKQFDSILFKQLTFNSQIGVMGHELSHISEYNAKRGIYFFRLLGMHLSKKRMDRFEFATDIRCIAHGLGFQLLSWSMEVRQKLKLSRWGGSNNNHPKAERYMNPETILDYMKQFPMYKLN
jgi:hypothetical protein